MAYADPEQVVQDFLVALVYPGAGEDRVRVVVGENLPDNLQHALRVVRVVQIPSSPGDAQPTLDVADVELNWYAGTRDRARDLSNTTRAAMRYQLPQWTHPASGAFVTQVRWLAAPAEAPSESSMFHRRMATARLWLHHNPMAA